MDTTSLVSRGQVDGRLLGKVALITGVGSGLGQDAALLFARAGAIVVGCDLDETKLKETVELLSAENLTIETAVLDATVEDAVREWVDGAATRHGGIDILYNNAGFAHYLPFEALSLAQWRETLRYELDIVFVPTQAAWPHLIARGGGSIINVASVSGMRGSEVVEGVGQTAHGAGKGGVIGFTHQLAAEGARHWIRVNAISPGPIVTKLTRDVIAANPSFRRLFEGCTLLARPGAPMDIAYSALFLASDESAFITGANLVVDGGATAKGGLSLNYRESD